MSKDERLETMWHMYVGLCDYLHPRIWALLFAQVLS
jgi:hypothetical protein